jgi:heptosyltransferase II
VNARAGLLLVLPNWLGDVVMTMPAIDALAAAGAPLHVAVRRRWAPLLAGDPRLAGLLAHERDGRWRDAVAMPRLAAQWRRTGAGAVLVGPPSWRMAAVAALAGIPVRVGYRTDGRGPLLTHPLAEDRPRGRVHYADQMSRLAAEVLRATGRTPDGPVSPWPRLPALDAVAAAALGDGPPAWVVCAGSTYGPAKTWPVARMADLLGLLVRQAGLRVLLVGDAMAAAFAAQLRAGADVPWRGEIVGGPGVIDLVGRTGLADVVALLKAGEVFVGNDSGLMHLAAALGRPTVGLFGSSSPEWTAPRGSRVTVLAAAGFPCRPCFRKTCNQPRFCLDTIAAAQVYAAASSLAAGAGGEVDP